MPIIFFDIIEIVHNIFIPAGSAANFACCYDVLQRPHANMRRLRPELWPQKNWLLHHDNALPHIFSFSGEFLTRNKMIVVPHLPYFSPFPRLKMELKGLHFDTVDVIEQRLRGTKHAFQDAFRK
jgi:hypothetical protein